MDDHRPLLDIRAFYDRFNAPITTLDCGKMCSPHNPSGKPFCCDICHAVPAAYRQEWEYLRRSTNLWHEWRGDECVQELSTSAYAEAGASAYADVVPEDPRAQMPENMLLLACQGLARCQRDFRAISCRQFPFYPYLTSDYRLIGLAYDWEFENTCWVISHLEEVSQVYRRECIDAYDALFSLWPDEMDSYAARSETARTQFADQKRRIPILYRGGGFAMISPRSERAARVDRTSLKRFGPYAG